MPRVADPRTKVELLRAAEAVFAERGLAAAKVEDITARAGVSKGAFYLHFESKDDCWRQIIEGFLAKLANCVEPRPEELAPAPDPRALMEVWHAHDLEVLEFCWQNRAILRMVLAGGGGVPYGYLIDELAARMAATTEKMVRNGVASGLYSVELQPEVAAALLSGAYDRLVRELIARPKRPDIEAWSRQAQRLFTRGMLADGPRAVLDREVSPGAAPSRAAPSRGKRRERAR
jgi:AcrR family transcriptional regulator